MENKKRGFAAMAPEIHREIARKGGIKVSANRDHMKAIGMLGGKAVSKDLDHMSRIGKLGAKKRVWQSQLES